MPPDEHDLYAVLGVTPDASQCQIGHAYRRLIRAYHPDIHPEPDCAALAAAVAAAAILRDPIRRAAYDRSRRPTGDQHPAPKPRLRVATASYRTSAQARPVGTEFPPRSGTVFDTRHVRMDTCVNNRSFP
jgi:curved DNA-binding protein CbpA